mmetsp:Transcript_92245/g.276798  ORF Transcript_92245/g.276798 Transcript_92245/m.276798 type:complete len:86 (-) Transcript_92245:21-278(-)
MPSNMCSGLSSPGNCVQKMIATTSVPIQMLFGGIQSVSEGGLLVVGIMRDCQASAAARRQPRGRDEILRDKASFKCSKCKRACCW